MIALILAAIGGFLFGIIVIAVLGIGGRAELEERLIRQEMLINAIKSNIKEKEELIKKLTEGYNDRQTENNLSSEDVLK